jgi:hypothetical protein
MIGRPKGPNLAAARDIGFQALAFLTEDQDRLLRFLRLTGLEPAELAAQAQSLGLLAHVLDHLLQDEALLLMFTANAGIDPQWIAPSAEILHRE